jgi:hypothetical protein
MWSGLCPLLSLPWGIGFPPGEEDPTSGLTPYGAHIYPSAKWHKQDWGQEEEAPKPGGRLDDWGASEQSGVGGFYGRTVGMKVPLPFEPSRHSCVVSIRSRF